MLATTTTTPFEPRVESCAIPPITAISSPGYVDPIRVVANQALLLLLIIPGPGPLLAVPRRRGQHGGSSPEVRSDHSRRAHAAHGAGSRHRRIPGRPFHSRGDAQPGRAALDRPTLGRALRYR